ncbi:MAG: hypothetical protein V1905_01750, partial [bacterium]
MKNRNKLFAVALFALTAISLVGVFAAPLEGIYPEITSGVIVPTTTKTLLPVYVKYIFSALVALSGIIAFGSGAYAGVRIAMSAGDPSAFSDAKDRLFAAGLGIAFTLGAVVILNTVDPQIVTFKPYLGIDLGLVLDKDAGCKDAKNPEALNQTVPSIMLVPSSNPDIDATFNARCMKFISTNSGTLEAKVYSSPNYTNLIGTYNNDTVAEATVAFPAATPRSISF